MGDLSAQSESREQARQLLAALGEWRGPVEASARRAEEARTLPGDMVDLLRSLGLFWLKTPRSLGGSELDPLDFCDVLEELAYLDASAAWAAMVGNGTTGTMAAWLPDEGVDETFSDPARLPIFAGQFAPRGEARPVEGGYLVTGRWGFCSGMEHADWLVGGCTVEGEPGVELFVTVPRSEATLHDTWHVAGLQGTGSGDFSLADRFVPSGRTFDWARTAPRRGGPLYRQPQILFIANELSPVMVGVARRALDDMVELAGGTARAVGGTALSERVAFQKELGRAEVRLRAARLLYRDAVEQSWLVGTTNASRPASFVPAIRAQHTYVAEECAGVVVDLFRYGGGRVLSLDSPLQRHLRNLQAALQHVYISEENYELAGRARLAEATGAVAGVA